MSATSVTSLFRTHMAAAMVAALLLALLLLALRPNDRASVRNSLVLLGLCGLAQIVDALAFSMGGLAAAAVAADVASVLVGLVLVRLAVIFVFHVALRAVRVEPARIVEDITTVALFAAWGIVWLRLAGVDLASLVTTSAIITAVIAFSMQQTLGNVLGGVVLQLDRTIREGDWVKVDDLSGRVVEISWRHTAIETRNGETVVVPNAWMMANRFTVIGTRSDPDGPWRRWIRLSVDLAAAPAEVCAVLEEAVRNAQIDNVVAERAPSAVLLDMGPRQGNYALRYWIRDRGPDDGTDSRVRIHLLAALERHGMRLGVPYTEQLNVADDAARHEAQHAGERARRLAALGRVDLFAHLTAAERETLAEHLVHAPFVAGDVMTRQGAVAHWLYLVIAGEADVWLDSGSGRTRIAALGAGDVFGEMGMMTGEPRRATVIARTDVECYRLDKSGFGEILRGRPDVAEAMSKVLSARAQELKGHRAAGDARAGAAPHADILDRIRRFFAIPAPAKITTGASAPEEAGVAAIAGDDERRRD